MKNKMNFDKEKYKFIIEIGSKFDYEDTMIIIKTAKENGIDFKLCDLKQLKEKVTEFKEYIPIGTIMFVQEWLKGNYEISKENPIEIPLYLRDRKYTKRDYKVVKACEIPSVGKYFLKSCNELKSFKYTGYMEYSGIQNLFEEKQNEFDFSTKLDREEPMVVSEFVNSIRAEYRVYVIQGKIIDTVLYEGNNEYKPDNNLIEEIASLINEKEEHLKSYTIDVYVGKQGTALLEIHNFTSVGLYKNNWGLELFQAYVDGIEYVLKDNKGIQLS